MPEYVHRTSAAQLHSMEVEDLRGHIVRICETFEEGGDLALVIDEAGRAVGRSADTRNG